MHQFNGSIYVVSRCHQRMTAHSDAQAWTSECPEVKNYK